MWTCCHRWWDDAEWDADEQQHDETDRTAADGCRARHNGCSDRNSSGSLQGKFLNYRNEMMACNQI